MLIGIDLGSRTILPSAIEAIPIWSPRTTSCNWRSVGLSLGENQSLITTEPGAAGENIFELGSKDVNLFKRHPDATSARNIIACRVGNLFGDGIRIGVELNCAGGCLISPIVPESVRKLDI